MSRVLNIRSNNNTKKVLINRVFRNRMWINRVMEKLMFAFFSWKFYDYFQYVMVLLIFNRCITFILDLNTNGFFTLMSVTSH